MMPQTPNMAIPPADHASDNRIYTDLEVSNGGCHGGHPSEIYYLCPDINTPSAGIRRLFRHVKLLCQAGYQAHIMHLHTGFRRSDMPDVPVRYIDRHEFVKSDIIVIPEGFPAIMDALKNTPGRCFAIALNWDYVFKDMPQGLNWQSFNIERVLVVSSVIGKMVAWSMGLPVHLLGTHIDQQQYYFDTGAKRPEVVYIERKAPQIDILKRLLGARNPNFIHNIKWIGLNGLPVEQYATQIRQASIFLNLSMAEGFPTSCMEAMASGTLVAGYDAIGGKELLRGRGADQNSIIVPTGDYISLAYALEQPLNSILEGNTNNYSSILSKAMTTASEFNSREEADALLSFWSEICSNGPSKHVMSTPGH